MPSTTASASEPETSAVTSAPEAPDSAGESSGVTGAEIDVLDQDGYNILTMPSTCRLTTYQGVFVDPSVDGPDTEGTERVREVILAGYEQDEDLRSEPVDSVDMEVVGTDAQIEMPGLKVSLRRDGNDLVDTFYYRGMPTADATLFMALSCEQQIIDAGSSEMEQVLDQITLNVVQP